MYLVTPAAIREVPIIHSTQILPALQETQHPAAVVAVAEAAVVMPLQEGSRFRVHIIFGYIWMSICQIISIASCFEIL
jgi:hypothetical protein